MHIKNLLIKNLIVTQINILNQITTNKVLDKNSTVKINRLNSCLYLPTNNQNKSFYNKTNRIKAFNKLHNKTFIAYNHFKGSKKAFNYKSYNSIKNEIFCRVDMLERFKRCTNKKVRWIYYKRGLVKILLLISNNKINEMMVHSNKIILKMILISSFSWSKIWIEFIPDKFTKDCRSPEIWGIFEPHFRLSFLAKDCRSYEIWGDFQFHFRLRYLN